MRLQLVSHALCPYVQRAAIALTEKRIAYQRTDIDLSAKPDWFLKISPFGKTPVLVADGVPLFESAPILEYLEDTAAPSLHPSDPALRARHRGWIEMSSSILSDIAGFYTAPNETAMLAKADAMADKFNRIQAELDEGPYFAGRKFSLVDAAFAPVFRYFDTFDEIDCFGILEEKPKLGEWRAALAVRPSVRGAVGTDYPDLLRAFLLRRDGALAQRMRAAA